MPHKRAKSSVRAAATAAAGYDNPPNAGDSIPHPNHPVASTSTSPLGIGVFAPKEEETRSNKRRKKQVKPQDKLNSFGGRKDLGGMSKTAHRILNAVELREAYNSEKKRKREEEESGINPNKKKKEMAPLPYESLRDFNRRVEDTLRPSISSAIQASKSSTIKKKAAAKAKTADSIEPLSAVEALKPSPSEAAPKAKPWQKNKKYDDDDDEQKPLDPHISKKRSGATEFAKMSQIRSVSDVVQAPPVLRKAKRGLDSGTSVTEPLPASRLPVNGVMKQMMEMEREKAIRAYREMKEKEKEQRVE